MDIKSMNWGLLFESSEWGRMIKRCWKRKCSHLTVNKWKLCYSFPSSRHRCKEVDEVPCIIFSIFFHILRKTRNYYLHSICIVIDKGSDKWELLKKGFLMREISHIYDTLVFYIFFFIIDKELRPSVIKCIYRDISLFEIWIFCSQYTFICFWFWMKEKSTSYEFINCERIKYIWDLRELHITSFWSWIEISEDVCEVPCCCYFSFFGYSFHSSDWKIWADDSDFWFILITYSTDESILIEEVSWFLGVSQICDILIWETITVRKDLFTGILQVNSSIMKYAWIILCYFFCHLKVSGMCDNCFHVLNII